MDTLSKIGLCELALGALLGWVVTLRIERPQLLARAGVASPRRILQAHLDYIMMGLILVAVGLALPGLQTWIAVPLVFGTLVNPTLFLPLAFDEGWKDRVPYKAVTLVSFVAMSGSLVAAAIEGLSR
ncbi:MAG: hypothetical protein HZB46_18935 [Solirubrobacterales bacterium]|nr:hypothetical protein [Solirubrobacterales bacterium]